MKILDLSKNNICLLLAITVALFSLFACASVDSEGTGAIESGGGIDTEGFLVVIDNEPDTVDFQCTSIYYEIAQTVFNRLVEIDTINGEMTVLPSLAASWEISEDRCRYVFHLRPGVKFSNGSALTSSDVLYSLYRLLTHPNSCNRDIAEMILGAFDLEKGVSESLEGFEILSDLDFAITLEQPFEAFLACLSMPGASIMDEETTVEAGERFGIEPEWTIGTGSYVWRSWEVGKGLILTANKDCFEGIPANEGIEMLFLTDPGMIRKSFEDGRLDIMDLDEVGNSADYYLHGDVYQDRLYQIQQIGTTYIALNQSVVPLDDVRVRKALQMALNRQALLDVVYSGRGLLENGIFPHGLYGYGEDLEEIPYDVDGARELLREAGFEDGFDLLVNVKASSTQFEMNLMTFAVMYWEKIGVRARIEVLDEGEFMRLRKSGKLACYTATWIADYNDPDNFIYTFFGNKENTAFRSLCYPDEEIMNRVVQARKIADPEERIAEYRELEKIIVQDNAAWIPLFSRKKTYVISSRLKGFRASWNGAFKSKYYAMSVTGT